MLDNMVNSTTIPILQQVVSFAQTRHGILASNIANMDVPGYRTRDVSLDTFQQALKEAIEARNDRREPVSPGLVSSDPTEPMRQVRESMRSILYHDNSDVGMEQQIAEIAKNQLMHNIAIAVMNSQFRLLQTAVSERV